LFKDKYYNKKVVKKRINLRIRNNPINIFYLKIKVKNNFKLFLDNLIKKNNKNILKKGIISKLKYFFKKKK
jgi:hypothetical protein